MASLLMKDMIAFSDAMYEKDKELMQLRTPPPPRKPAKDENPLEKKVEGMCVSMAAMRSEISELRDLFNDLTRRFEAAPKLEAPAAAPAAAPPAAAPKPLAPAAAPAAPPAAAPKPSAPADLRNTAHTAEGLYGAGDCAEGMKYHSYIDSENGYHATLHKNIIKITGIAEPTHEFLDQYDVALFLPENNYELQYPRACDFHDKSVSDRHAEVIKFLFRLYDGVSAYARERGVSPEVIYFEGVDTIDRFAELKLTRHNNIPQNMA